MFKVRRAVRQTICFWGCETQETKKLIGAKNDSYMQSFIYQAMKRHIGTTGNLDLKAESHAVVEVKQSN